MRLIPLLLLALVLAAPSKAASIPFSSQFGDPGSAAAAIALDPQGNIIVAGRRTAPIPATGGDLFVKKFSPDGANLLSSASFGSTAGTDSISGIAVDSKGAVYVTGTTISANFSVTPDAFQKMLVGNQSAFVAKLEGAQLIYSSFLGGGSSQGGGIAVDANGAAYIVGTTGPNFPVTANAFQKSHSTSCSPPPGFFGYPMDNDAFVAKVSPDGSSLEYATYLGGGCGEYGNTIAVNPDGSAWVAGATFSPDFPVTTDALQPKPGGGFGDAYLARISASGDSLEYATFLGGKFLDQVNSIASDSAGNLFLAGISGGFLQPPTAGAYQQQAVPYCFTLGIGPVQDYYFGSAFVMKLNSAGTEISALSYLGTACATTASAIAVDSTDSPWIVGSGGFLIPSAIPLEIQAGNGFISKFSPDLTQLLFSTSYLDVSGLAVGASGDALVAGASGFGSNAEAFLAEIDPAPEAVSLDNVLSPSPFTPSYAGGAEGIAPGKFVRVTGRGIGPEKMTPGVVRNGVLQTTVAGVEITFDGVPAPLLYVSATELGCVIPFGISQPVAGLAITDMQITYNGVASNTVPIPLQPLGVTPEVLAVYNADFTPNSAAHPLKAGSYAILYVTGAGQTTPASTDGEVYSVPPPLAANKITIQGQNGPLNVTFAGGAPGLADGILQVNFQAPPALSSGVVQGATISSGAGSANFLLYVK
ncbi:MAG TPA: SBBP repeat-containing protein [Bryobacteraceae bacterium]|nr:SBBP repeat-containing protein [Bryobacteraceae bacterium]